MARYPFKYSRVGGMRFLRICNLQLSWCITRKECREVGLRYSTLAFVGMGLGAALAVALG